MGQRTLAFTKRMLRVFNFVEFEEFGHLVVKAWLPIPRSSETITIYSQHTTNTNSHKQANIYRHKNTTSFK
jgi:hypothetical protein